MNSTNCRFQFQKRGQIFIGTHNETLSVASMRRCNPDRSPLKSILNDGMWNDPPNLTLTFDGTNSTAFAYIEGMGPEVVIPDGQTEINAVLTLTNTADPNDVQTVNFQVRRPPIMSA